MLAQYEKIKDFDLSFETRIADAMVIKLALLLVSNLALRAQRYAQQRTSAISRSASAILIWMPFTLQ